MSGSESRVNPRLSLVAWLLPGDKDNLAFVVALAVDLAAPLASALAFDSALLSTGVF